MIKKTTVLIFYLIFPVVLFSQELSQSVFLSQGQVDMTDTMTLEWTLGDPFVEMITQKDILFTQGFLQPELLFRTSNLTTKNAFQISIYPNPFEAHLSIKVNEDSIFKIKLYDLNGRVLHSEITAGNPSNYNLETEHLVAGFYMLSILNTVNNQLEIYKVVKK